MVVLAPEALELGVQGWGEGGAGEKVTFRCGPEGGEEF